MMRILTVAAAVAMLSLSLGSPAYAQSRPGGWGHGHEGLALLRSAGLTDAQREQVRQILTNHRPNFQRLAGDLRTAREALNAKLYGTDPVTAADLAPLADQVGKVRSQMAQERTQVALEIRNILTPDQLARVAQTRQRLNELRSEMRTLLRGAP
jgi:Spy/CpxP family protein refolding chaperone